MDTELVTNDPHSRLGRKLRGDASNMMVQRPLVSSADLEDYEKTTAALKSKRGNTLTVTVQAVCIPINIASSFNHHWAWALLLIINLISMAISLPYLKRARGGDARIREILKRNGAVMAANPNCFEQLRNISNSIQKMPRELQLEHGQLWENAVLANSILCRDPNNEYAWDELRRRSLASSAVLKSRSNMDRALEKAEDDLELQHDEMLLRGVAQSDIQQVRDEVQAVREGIRTVRRASDSLKPRELAQE